MNKVATHVGMDDKGRKIPLRETAKSWIACDWRNARWPKGAGRYTIRRGGAWSGSIHCLDRDTIRPLTMDEMREPLLEAYKRAIDFVGAAFSELERAKTRCADAEKQRDDAYSALLAFDREHGGER